MTPTLSASIRRHIDATAPPLTIDEIITDHATVRATVTPDRGDPRPRTRLGLIAAAALVGVGAVALSTTTRPDSGDVETATTATSDPAWYAALAPALPTGFQSVAVTESNDWFVRFESFDPADGRSLQFTVSRVAIEPDPGGAITLDQALATPPGQPLEQLDISLPDGRQIGLACVIDLGLCPTEGAAAMSPLELRDFAIHLATDVGPAVLPAPVGTLDHVPVSDIRAATAGVVELPEAHALEAPHYAMSFVQYAPDPFEEGDLDPAFVVHTLTGLYPTPPPSGTIRRTDTRAGTTQWIITPDGVLWAVTDTTGGDAAVAQRVLSTVTTTMP